MNNLHKLLIAYLAPAALAAGATPNAETFTVTFDDLPAKSNRVAKVSDGYEGLHWYHFSYLDAADMGTGNPLHNALVSAKNLAIDVSGLPAWIYSSRQPFSLDSAFLTAEGEDVMRVRVEGFDGRKLKYDHIYTLRESKATFITFNYLDVTKVEFIPLDWTPHHFVPFDNGYYSLFRRNAYFALDNVTITAVPEPGAQELLALGFALVGFNFVRIKRRNLSIHRRRLRSENE